MAKTRRSSSVPELRYTVLRVVMPAPAGDPEGGYLEHEIQTTTEDQTAFEFTAHRQKWPDPAVGADDDKGHGSNVWLTFLGWSACKRERLIPEGMKFEEFRAHVLECLPVGTGKSDDESSGGAVPPTRQDPDIGS